MGETKRNRLFWTLSYRDFSELRDILRYIEIWWEMLRGKKTQKFPLEGKTEKYETQGKRLSDIVSGDTLRDTETCRRDSVRETWGGNDSDIEVQEGKHRHRDLGVDSETETDGWRP